MKINLQLFGGRGASSSISKTSTTGVSLNIPNGATKQQSRMIQSLYDGVIKNIYGSTSDSYEIKTFDISVNKYSTSVYIQMGLKNDEGTMASVLARRQAMFFIGKNGGLKHIDGASNNLKRTKYWYQAFYDYDKRKK